MKKIIILSLIFILSIGILASCAEDQPQEQGGMENAEEEEEPGEEPEEEEEEEEIDTETTASIVDDEEAFKEAISEDGEWIIATLNDLSFDEELVVEGVFHDKGDPDNEEFRKIAPYEQDDNYNVTERHTITAPRMTIRSPNTKYQAGTFEGDIYIEAEGFTLDDATVEGNIYFTSEEYESSAEIKDNSEVTGDVEVE
ncbi:MAG: hypothetical protein ACOC4G_13425 [Bacillota bacterium]